MNSDSCTAVSHDVPPLPEDGTVFAASALKSALDAWVEWIALQRSAWRVSGDRRAAAALDAALVSKRVALDAIDLNYFGAARHAAETLLWEQVAYVDSTERSRLNDAYSSGLIPVPPWSIAYHSVTACAHGDPAELEIHGASTPNAPSRPALADCDWPPRGRWAATDPPPLVAGGYEAGVTAGFRAGFLAALDAMRRTISPGHADLEVALDALAARACGPVPRAPDIRSAPTMPTFEPSSLHTQDSGAIGSSSLRSSILIAKDMPHLCR